MCEVQPILTVSYKIAKQVVSGALPVRGEEREKEKDELKNSTLAPAPGSPEGDQNICDVFRWGL
jgi:hypothetical protein